MALLWLLAVLVKVYQGHDLLLILAVYRTVEYAGYFLELGQMFSSLHEIVTLKRLTRPTIIFQMLIVVYKLFITVVLSLTPVPRLLASAVPAGQPLAREAGERDLHRGHDGLAAAQSAGDAEGRQLAAAHTPEVPRRPARRVPRRSVSHLPRQDLQRREDQVQPRVPLVGPVHQALHRTLVCRQQPPLSLLQTAPVIAPLLPPLSSPRRRFSLLSLFKVNYELIFRRLFWGTGCPCSC